MTFLTFEFDNNISLDRNIYRSDMEILIEL